LLTLRWTFPAKRASVVVTDSESGRLAPLPPRQRPVASRGVWVVAAPCCAATPSQNAERSANEPDRQGSEVSLYGTSHQTGI
jgi:hypothetical protein